MSNRTTQSPATPSSQTGMSSTMTTSGSHGAQTGIPHEKIARRAYEKWCQRGCPDGTHQQDWYAAEAELRSEMMGQGSKGGQAAQTMQQPAAPRAAQPATAMPQKTAQRR